VTEAHRRWLSVRLTGDEGNAIVEFVYLAVLLMVPLVYVLLTVFRVQSAAYSVSGAAREAGRVFATAPSVEKGEERAYVAAGIVMSDSQLELGRHALTISCSNDPCLEPGSTIEVTVEHHAELPFLPALFGSATPSIKVSSSHLEVVDRYRRGAS
jgi:hypothetical protein